MIRSAAAAISRPTPAAFSQSQSSSGCEPAIRVAAAAASVDEERSPLEASGRGEFGSLRLNPKCSGFAACRSIPSLPQNSRQLTQQKRRRDHACRSVDRPRLEPASIELRRQQQAGGRARKLPARGSPAKAAAFHFVRSATSPSAIAAMSALIAVAAERLTSCKQDRQNRQNARLDREEPRDAIGAQVGQPGKLVPSAPRASRLVRAARWQAQRSLLPAGNTSARQCGPSMIGDVATPSHHTRPTITQ